LRAEWAAGHGRAVIFSAIHLDLVECDGEFFGDTGEVFDTADGRAVSVDSDFIELAEGGLQSGESLLHFFQADVWHAGVDDYGYREGKGIAGKKFQDLRFTVFEQRDVLGLETADQAAVSVFYHDWHQD
jgi:hypothetical protein